MHEDSTFNLLQAHYAQSNHARPSSRTKRRREHQRGLTLVEMLAVVVILALVAGTLLLGFSGAFGQAKHELAKTAISVVVSKIEYYRMSHGAYPPNDLGVDALTDGHSKPTDSWYLQPGQLLDPWNRSFIYATPGRDGHPFEVVTYGADGKPGGQGEDGDLSSTALRGKESPR